MSKTQIYYVLKRDTVSPFLNETGRHFTTLSNERASTWYVPPMKFATVRQAVLYLKTNPPDVNSIVRVAETIPDVTPTFIETEVT